MNTRFLTLSITCATWLAAACGGDAGSPSTDPNTSSLITDVCQNMRALACGSAAIEQQCLDDLQADRQDAENEGCAAELDAYLTCAADHPMGCSAIEGEPPRPDVDSACNELNGAFHECVTGVGPECGVSFGPGTDSVSCGVTCEAFRSMCHGPSQDGPLECTCETGPQAGTTFQASNCSRGLIMATGHSCAE